MMRSGSVHCNILMMMTLMMLFISAVMAAAEVQVPRIFKVGDEFGWRVPLQNDTAVYNHWASSNRFHIGDSLCEYY